MSQKSGKRLIKSVIQADDWAAMVQKVLSANRKCESLMHLTDTKEERTMLAQRASGQKTSLDIQKRLLDLFEQSQEHQFLEKQDVQERALLQDLATVSNYKTDKNFVSTRIAGTCECFFEDQAFKLWRDCPESSLLWVTAGPGCGKSVLARALIDERRVSRSVLSSTVCYFFFKDSQERRTQSKHALGALLHQLFQASDLIKHGLASHRSHSKSLLEAFDDMWDILLKAASDPNAGEIICVIDALDECEQTSRLQLLDRLITFYSRPDLKTTSTVLKFLVTSRPYEDLDDRFQHLRDVTNYIRCDGDEHSQRIAWEINIVIDVRIKEILPNHSQSNQTLIANRMKSQGNRTYLWLFLTIDIINSSRSKYRKLSSIQSLMDDLPMQIADAYEKILSRSSDEIVARRLLQIIVAAREPLTLQEANIALTLATQPECQSLDELEFWPSETFAADIKNICGLLVTCYDDRVALIHQTAREFLIEPLGPAKSGQKSWRGSVETTEADELMAEICTKYLIALDTNQLRTRYGDCVLRVEREQRIGEEEIDEEELGEEIDEEETNEEETDEEDEETIDEDILERRPDLEARFPLLQYSARNWTSHYRNQTHYMAKYHNPSFQRASVLCDAEALYCEWWLLYVGKGHFPRNARSSLLLAIYQGLNDLIEANLSQYSDKDLDWVNTPDTRYSSFAIRHEGVWGPPLHLALARGRLSTVKTLLDFGADIDLHSNGFRPLQIASLYGNQDLVELLLDNGADVNASVEIGVDSETGSNGARETALICAVESHHFWITEILLRHGANVNARASEESDTALNMAIFEDANHITKLLLDHKADTELIGGGLSCTPLQAAVLWENFEVIHLLLQRGADVSAKSAKVVSAMHIASHTGKKDIMELLLDAGADINVRADISSGSNFMGTPIWLAALQNRPRTVNFLLDHGADPNISAGPFGTPLEVAKIEGCLEVVNVLMGKGGASWNDDERGIFEPSVEVEIPKFLQGDYGYDLLEG